MKRDKRRYYKGGVEERMAKRRRCRPFLNSRTTEICFPPSFQELVKRKARFYRHSWTVQHVLEHFKVYQHQTCEMAWRSFLIGLYSTNKLRKKDLSCQIFLFYVPEIITSQNNVKLTLV